MDIATSSFTVFPHDMDLNGHMNNGRYLSILDLARLDHTIRTGLMRTIIRKGIRPVVAAQTIRYRRPLKLFQNYHVKTRVLGWTGEWLFLEQVFCNDSGVLAIAYVRSAMLISGKKQQIQSILDSAEIDMKNQKLPDFIAQWQRCESDSRVSYEDLFKLA